MLRSHPERQAAYDAVPDILRTMQHSATLQNNAFIPALHSWEVNFPTVLLAQLNTHRALSRNTSSFRAIPTATLVEQIEKTPFIPRFHERGIGMNVGKPLEGWSLRCAVSNYIAAMRKACNIAQTLALYTDKGACNRVLTPFTFSKVIVSGCGSGLANFFRLRASEDAGAQDDFQIVASEMRKKAAAKDFRTVTVNAIHAPAWLSEGTDCPEKIIRTIARIARVSYNNHFIETTREKDLEFVQRLYQMRHMSPFEHIALATRTENLGKFSANFEHYWIQLRAVLTAVQEKQSLYLFQEELRKHATSQEAANIFYETVALIALPPAK